MNTAFSSIATNKQSPYGIFLKSAINEMRKNGLLDRLSKKWSDQDNSCDSLTKSGSSLSVEKSITIFLILAFGAVLALVILIIEKLWISGEVEIPHKTDEVEVILEFLTIWNQVHIGLKNMTCPDRNLLTKLQKSTENLKKL